MVLASTSSFRELVGGSAGGEKNLVPPETFFTELRGKRVDSWPWRAASSRSRYAFGSLCGYHSPGCHRIATFKGEYSTDSIYWQIEWLCGQEFGGFDPKFD